MDGGERKCKKTLAPKETLLRTTGWVGSVTLPSLYSRYAVLTTSASLLKVLWIGSSESIDFMGNRYLSLLYINKLPFYVCRYLVMKTT